MDRRSILKGAALATVLEVGVSAPAMAQVQGGGLPGKDYAGTLGKLRTYAEMHLAKHGLAGMTVVMVDRDGFQATFQIGQADVDKKIPVGPDHVFQIGSISKSFAAVCILQAVEKGKLNLDTPVSQLLPELPLPSTPITVRHLLSHVSGLPDDPPLFPRGGDGRLWLGYAPTTNFSYSNLGYRMLGLIIERVEKRPYFEVIQRQILDPLGMKATHPVISTTDRNLYAVGYQPFRNDRPAPWPGPIAAAPWVDFDEASGSVASTPADMGRYVRFIIDAANGKSALLSKETGLAFVKPVTKAPDFGPTAQYALGVAVVQFNGRQMIHHTGGMIAFCSSFHVDAESGVGCFASTNTNINGYRPRQVTAYACELLRALREGKPAPGAPAIELGDTAAKPDEFTGNYHGATGGFSIRNNNGTLELVDAGAVATLQQKGGDAFLVRNPAYARHLLTFMRKDGKVYGAGHGQRTYGRNGAAPLDPQAPAAIAGFAGRYDNDDPWLGSTQVLARADGLTLDGTTPLVPLPDGSYRLGDDPQGCERIRFDAVVDGVAQRMNFSGVDFWRKPDV